MSFHGKNQGIKFEDTVAEKEWGWKPEYALDRMIEDFYGEMRRNPERYQ
jgi:nucleoside-diphosphate-sugar epimerase